jgi:hypothetical protein
MDAEEEEKRELNVPLNLNALTAAKRLVSGTPPGSETAN